MKLYLKLSSLKAGVQNGLRPNLKYVVLLESRNLRNAGPNALKISAIT
jgi:hypothetical protein